MLSEPTRTDAIDFHSNRDGMNYLLRDKLIFGHAPIACHSALAIRHTYSNALSAIAVNSIWWTEWWTEKIQPTKPVLNKG